MKKNFDAIVIGSGQSGPFVAVRMAAAGQRVASYDGDRSAANHQEASQTKARRRHRRATCGTDICRQRLGLGSILCDTSNGARGGVMGFLSELFSAPKPKHEVIIYNVLHEEIDRIPSRDLYNQDLR